MSFGDKVKDSIVNRAAEGLAVSATLIVIWVMSKIGPAILLASESNLSKSLLVSLLLGSLALNLILVTLFWVLRKKPEFKLKYGIYWDSDKNPLSQIAKYLLALTMNIRRVGVITASHVEKSSLFLMQRVITLNQSKH